MFWEYENTDEYAVQLAVALEEEIRESIHAGQLYAPRVYVEIKKDETDESVRIYLRDDGNGLEYIPEFDFESPKSGDLVANDFFYSIKLNSFFAAEEGLYEFKFVATEDPRTYSDSSVQIVPISDTLTFNVQVSVNNAPTIETFTVPDSLHSGFDASIWQAQVEDIDPDIGGEVIEVELNLYDEQNSLKRELQLAQMSETIWTFSTDASFAASHPTGVYSFELLAKDRFNAVSEPLVKSVWIENTAPVISDLVAPDTTWRPVQDSIIYVFELTVEDFQTQLDIAEVSYSVINPQGEPGTSPFFVFNDSGIDPDEVAGDGVWSHGFKTEADPERTNFGTYTFIFVAIDRAGNESNSIEKEILYLDGWEDLSTPPPGSKIPSSVKNGFYTSVMQ